MAAQSLVPIVGVLAACVAMAVSRATFYRRRAAERLPHDDAVDVPTTRAPSPRQLSDAERRIVLAELSSERFLDTSPAEAHATLLEEGRWLCSVRTMYRILAAAGGVRERRNQLTHPEYAKPELLANSPNEVWTWDITKLKGPVKWTYYYLYVILDIFSRYVVGWMLAPRESAALAKRLITETCEKQEIVDGQLIIHADRGTSMTSKAVAHLYADLGVTKSHSRPHVSDDNPFSEANFKTLKYRPDFPARFGGQEDARAHCMRFFTWYNTQHRHSGIAMLTPEDVHYGRGQSILDIRHKTILAAYEAHPERFVKGPPAPQRLPHAVWINPPKSQASPEGALQ